MQHPLPSYVFIMKYVLTFVLNINILFNHFIEIIFIVQQAFLINHLIFSLQVNVLPIYLGCFGAIILLTILAALLFMLRRR